jgi:hypothetical protein
MKMKRGRVKRRARQTAERRPPVRREPGRIDNALALGGQIGFWLLLLNRVFSSRGLD